MLLAHLALAISLSPGDPIIEEVRVNGHGPFRFLIDTGAQSSVLHPGIAAKMGLSPAYAVQVESATGNNNVPAALADLTAAGQTAPQAEILLYTPALGLDGVLGQSFLSAFDYVLDFEARRLTINPAGAVNSYSAEGRIPFDLVSGRPAVTAVHPQGARLLLDSGASHPLFFRHVPGTRLGQGSLRTHHGGATVDWVCLEKIQIGGWTAARLKVAVAVRPTASIDGLLPLNLFRAVYISNSTRSVRLEPRASPSGASAPKQPRRTTTE